MSMVALAVYLAWLGMTTPAALNAPPWILYVLATSMALGALALWARMRGRHPLNQVFAALLLFCFAATGYWIAFSPGATCTVSITQIDDEAERAVPSSSAGCRVAFGSGAVLTTAMGLLALAMARRPGKRL